MRAYEGDSQRTVERIEAMLALGLKRTASCETKELAADGTDDAKNLLKAMYLYASGEWLDAIKKFVKLPRTF